MRWLILGLVVVSSCDKPELDVDSDSDLGTVVDPDPDIDSEADTAAFDDNGVCDEGEAGTPDCNGICEDGEGNSADCDGVCTEAEASTSDCDGLCTGEDAGPDCDGLCDTGESGSDCDGLCEDGESNSADCDDVCDPGEEGTVDCEVIEEVTFPSNGSPCGIAFDERTDTVFVIQCFGADILTFSPDGTPGPPVARPGESANDVDIDIAPAAFTLGTTSVPAGGLLIHNGETGVVETYLVDPTDGSVTGSLTTEFGASHVVGGSFDTNTGQLVYVQDLNVSAPNGNAIATVDPGTGELLELFATAPDFIVNYGDMDVCQTNGHRFVVSSNESTVAEYGADGTLLAEHSFPATVSGASGIDFNDQTGEAWIAAFNGPIWRVDGLPCPPALPDVNIPQ